MKQAESAAEFNLSQWLTLVEHQAKKITTDSHCNGAHLKLLVRAGQLLNEAKRALREGKEVTGKELLIESVGMILGAAALDLEAPPLNMVGVVKACKDAQAAMN